ncbi:hypothetical protein BDV96DRAFT_1243 [Lophiotrema nucula]|uniref:Zn(2)-C6 fungal-type domain-containing protein n=1 Tax=Lophiotrema nucula TaxID=690887 RepID=A0A6A5ZS31_9PLEO|nr:hypothetical protein BDV96DRAFT_1243 [Lophiotrema nucula]
MEGSEEPPSPVRALRDAFGDNKPPDISRKITACVACRKQKIKCHMKDGKAPCTRCKKRGLPCTVNRSLQMLLENDTVWKHSMEAKMKKLESIISDMANFMSPEARSRIQSQLEAPVQLDPRVANPLPPEFNSHGVADDEVIMDLESGPGDFPASHLLQSQPRTPTGQEDLITKGIISLEDAETFYDMYCNRLDHFRYRIMGDLSTTSLEGIRKISPLLTAAVCTVGALHLASKDFDRCYDEFVSLCAARSFNKVNNVDEVRARCIGAFWLSGLSSSLSASAVRMATDLQLHRSMPQAMQGDRTHYLRIRLYLLVYVVDHQCSIAYGRPPMTRECGTIRDIRRFLECKHATVDDGRLVSQVLRWNMCGNVYDTFGDDVERSLTDTEIPHLRYLSNSLDNLRAEFANKFSLSQHVGNYPQKGVALQYYFAKLYLTSHVFRGAASGRFPYRPDQIRVDENMIAEDAVGSALAIIDTVNSDVEIQAHLNGLPLYFHIMVAFAAVFLYKVSTKYSSLVRVDVERIKHLMSTLVETLKRITSTMHPRHLLVSIEKGIDSLHRRMDLLNVQAGAFEVPGPHSHQAPPVTAPFRLDVSEGYDWAFDGAFDPDSMIGFDLLSNTGLDFPLDTTFGNISYS